MHVHTKESIKWKEILTDTKTMINWKLSLKIYMNLSDCSISKLVKKIKKKKVPFVHTFSKTIFPTR